MSFLDAFIIAIIEGLTEFLPVSSTGHMILTSAILGLKSSPFLNLYIVCIQFGAILSVVALYHKRFFQSIHFYLVLICAIIPTAIIGVLLKKYVDEALGSVLIVGINLLFGGMIMLFLEYYFKGKNLKETPITYKKAFWIGVFQAISIFPGVSRSAATIYGGMFQKLTRKEAAEFSFFLAVPIMFLATVKDLYDFLKENTLDITGQEVQLLLFGNVVAFLVAMAAIKFFIQYIVRHGFTVFAIYRIIVGLIVIYSFYYLNLTVAVV